MVTVLDQSMFDEIIKTSLFAGMEEFPGIQVVSHQGAALAKGNIAVVIDSNEDRNFTFRCELRWDFNGTAGSLNTGQYVIEIAQPTDLAEYSRLFSQFHIPLSECLVYGPNTAGIYIACILVAANKGCIIVEPGEDEFMVYFGKFFVGPRGRLPKNKVKELLGDVLFNGHFKKYAS